MANRLGNARRNGRGGGPGQHIAQAFQIGDPEEGFAKQIYRLTGAGETVLDVMSRTILTPDEADLIAAAWLRGVRIAQDPESPYDAEKLVKDPIAKFAGQITVGLVVGGILMWLSSQGSFSTQLAFPFFKELSPFLGWMYLPFATLVLVAASNAVNLTDGLDGLAAGTTLIAAGTYTVFAYLAGHFAMANYLNIIYVPDAAEVTVFVGALVGVAITRELGPLMTAIVMAGRVGASFTAEMGTMKVSDEILALETMALNPVKFLITPRFIAIIIMLPCLTVMADFMGMLGGYLVGTTTLGIHPVP